jgi:hypothetical protein
MRQKARGSRSVRRATQVQARTKQLAAGDGVRDDVLLVTHGHTVAGPPTAGQSAPVLYMNPVSPDG